LNEAPALPAKAMRSADSVDCNEYLFDSALANLEYTNLTISKARRVVAYAPADTNTLGWTQLR
jgi:hypothetical protein